MKKRLFILALISILLLPGMVSAKSYQAEIFGYGGTEDDYFADVEATSDGGYITVGRSSSTEIDNITDNSITDAIIVKYDKNNKLLWQRSYGGSSYDVFNKVIETQDGGYVAVGETGSKDIEGLTFMGNNDAIIVKYDKNGNIEWQQNYGGSNIDYFSSITVTQDGGYIAVGNSKSTTIEGITNKGYYDAIIVKYDKNGKMEWQQSYGGKNSDYFYDIKITSDGGYIASGSTSSADIEGLTFMGNTDAVIVKYDKNGNIEWQQNYGGSSLERFEDIEVTEDGDFVVVGLTFSRNISGISKIGDSDGIIVKYNKDGNMLWQRNHNDITKGSYELQFNNVVVDEDGNYFVVGTSLYNCEEQPSRVIEPVEPTDTCNDSFFVVGKYNKDGSLEWQQNYGGNDLDVLFGVTYLTGGEYIAVGNSYSANIEGYTNQGAYDAVILEVNTIYDITEEEPTNGEFTTIQVGKRGMIEVKPSAGYVVDKITVTDSLDNEVTTYKENDNYYFELYDDVKVRVTFKEASILDIINPETGSGQLIEFIAIICLIIGGIIYFNKKKVFGTK